MQQLIEILNKVFRRKHTGTYLEIGSYDGVTDNVTHFFYQHGWRGICVEPQTKYFKLGVAERPGDLWVKGVVVDKYHGGKTATFYEDETGQRSSTWFSSLETKKKQLKAIQVNRDIPRGRFENGLDLLVINIGNDGHEVLKSIDMGLWKPNIVVIEETHTIEDIDPIAHMQSMGYYHLAPTKTGDWLVFSNNIEDRANV